MFLRSVEALHFVDFLHALEERHRISRTLRHLQAFFDEFEHPLARVHRVFGRSDFGPGNLERCLHFGVLFKLFRVAPRIGVPGASR